jgi:uncharacterized membrane protein YbhN (UPF0104 family)
MTPSPPESRREVVDTDPGWRTVVGGTTPSVSPHLAPERSRGWTPAKIKTVGLVVLAALLYASASVGMSKVVGFSEIRERMGLVEWPWLLATMGSVVVGLACYSVAWTGIVDAGKSLTLSRRERVTTAIVGFGGFLERGGSTVDRHVMQAHGVKKRDIAVRIAALDGLEHAPLAIGCCCLAIVVLTKGHLGHLPSDFVWPWAVVPPVGAVAAVWLTRRYRETLRTRHGLLGWCGVGLDSLYLLRQMATMGRRVPGLPYLAMAGYWIAELFALWAALATFGFRMSMPSLVFAYVAAYVITRRPAPLGGAGPLDLLLPLSLWACGAPLSAAVAASIAYRFFSLWLPFPLALREAAHLAAKRANTAIEPEPALS